MDDRSSASGGSGTGVDLVVTEEQLLLLADRIDGTFSSLSPFEALRSACEKADNSPGLPGTCVDGEGRLRAPAAAALSIMAEARSLGSISFAGRGLVFESAAYFRGSDGGAGVSLTNQGPTLRIRYPHAAGAAVEMLSLQTGDSLLRRIDIETDLAPEEGAVFFGCLDAVRRKELSLLLGHDGGSAYRVAHVEEALGASEVGMQWLAPLFLRFTGRARPSGEVVQAGLTGLLRKDIVRKDQGGWRPSPLLRQAAAELLLVDAHLRLRQAESGKDDEVSVSDLRVVQGRSGAFLAWTCDASSVSVTGVSAAQVTILARSVMRPHLESAGKSGRDDGE